MNFSNITFGQYIPRNSIIHKLDPRAKLLGLLILVSAVFTIKNFCAFGISVLALLCVIRASKIPAKSIVKSSRPVLFLIIFTFAFNMIALIFRYDFREAFLQAIFTSSRLLVLMIYAILLPLTTTPLELADGICALMQPFRKFLPVNDISMMLGIALRFIPLLMQEADKIMKSQISRGAKLDQGNIFQRARAFFPVLIPLFVIIFRRADEVAIAMEVRGYGNAKIRTRRKPLIWKFQDTFAIIICAILAGIFTLA